MSAKMLSDACSRLLRSQRLALNTFHVPGCAGGGAVAREGQRLRIAAPLRQQMEAEGRAAVAEHGRVVIPGDTVVHKASLCNASVISVGQGLSEVGGGQVASRCGTVKVLKGKSGGGDVRVWVDGNSRRYSPAAQDMVVGVVMEKRGEDFRVDIRGPIPGLLPALAFEGATKRSRPKLEPGTTVYCRVAVASRDMEPELSCICPTHKRGWMTGQAVFGELLGGHIVETSVAYARSLLLPESVIVNTLGNYLAYELAVGVNGRVWVKSGSVAKTILVANAIRNAEYMPAERAEQMVTQLVSYLEG